MKIKITHIPNTFNYGSLMMAVNVINFLNNNLKNVEFYVDCRSNLDLKRLKYETGLSNIFIELEFKQTSKSKFKNLLNKISVILSESKFYDIRIVLGGDDISEYYQKNWVFRFPLMYLENIKLPTIFLGQTIGPFTSYRKLLAKITLNKANIFTRDDNCLRYLSKLGITTAQKGRDLAFLDLPMQNNSTSILNKYSLVPKTYLTIVPSGLTNSYTNNYENYLDEHYNIIKYLVNSSSLKEKMIVLLAHVKDGTASDKSVISDLQGRLTKEERSKIIVITDDILASEARTILGNGLFTITGRMHAAVSTYFMRRPSIVLSYGVKYQGVIGDGLGMSCLVIEASDNKLWATNNISRIVAERVNYIIENYDELTTIIDRSITGTTEIVLQQLETLVVLIKKLAPKA